MSITKDLIARAKIGDNNASEQLVKDNSGLIWSIARRFQGRGVEMDDLYQLGCLGFLKAIEGFDLEYGTQFSTYAVPKIAGEIRRFLRDDGALKVSRGIKERAAAIKITRGQLIQKLGREPTVSELAEVSGFTPEEIAVAETATAGVESIHQESGEDGFTLENVLADTTTEELILDQISLRQAIDKLPDRENKIIKLRYYHGLTQDRVSKVMGVSQVQISRIEKKALEQLKEYIR